MAKVRFHPWKGKNYGSRHPRLLVVGNSHYATSDQNCSDLTCETVGAYPNDINPGPKAFFTKLARAISGEGYKTECKDVLDSIAFYNFSQELVGEKPRVAPTDSAIELSKDAFWEVTAELRPSHVLVLGNQVWAAIENSRTFVDVQVGDITDRAYHYTRGKASFWILKIRHPSGAFNPMYWHQWVHQLLSL